MDTFTKSAILAMVTLAVIVALFTNPLALLLLVGVLVVGFGIVIAIDEISTRRSTAYRTAQDKH